MESNAKDEPFRGFEEATAFLGYRPEFHDAYISSLNISVYERQITILFLGFTYRDEATGAAKEETFICRLTWSEIIEANLSFDGEAVLEFDFEEIVAGASVRTIIWTSGGSCSTIDAKFVTMSEWSVREWETNNAQLALACRLGDRLQLVYDGPGLEPRKPWEK